MRKALLNKFFFGSTLLVCLAGSAGAQNFVDGMKLFNQAKYDTLVRSFIPTFIAAHPEEEGLARYFLGESLYNLALTQSGAERAVTLFQRAYSEFDRAHRKPDLKAAYPEYYFYARYKMGWSAYRLAELNHETGKMLESAWSDFTGFEAEAPDSLRLLGSYMAGKARLRWCRLQMYDPSGAFKDAESVQRVQKGFTEAQQRFDEVQAFQGSSEVWPNLVELQNASRAAQLSLQYLIGQWSLALARHGTVASSDPAEWQQRAAHKFQNILEQTNQSESFQGVPSPVLSYTNLLAALGSYFATGQVNAKQRLIDAWNELVSPEFESERQFRRANLYHAHPVATDDFNELARRYYEASSGIPESYYWLAHNQMTLDHSKESRANFGKFLDFASRDSQISSREQILYEDARFRKYLLDFEALYLSSRYISLRALAKEIEGFKPTSVAIQERKELLSLLVNCSLTKRPSQLWTDVLTGSDEVKLQQARNTIMFILPRAALSIGMTRERYLTLLHRLFEITKTRNQEETRFFQGIAKTLEAEIQAHPAEKAAAYRESAEILTSISNGGPNKDEAEYLRARCLFFGDDFDEAEKLLIQLVNQKRYLRALFFLAEIYRTKGQGLAAKKCYQVIIDKLGDTANEFDKYWTLNARAGFQASNDEGSIFQLDGVDIAAVEFQPGLEPQALTYEKLADERFLQRQSARESVDWLITYGLPKKEVYASRHRIDGSFFEAENVFENYTGVIDEVRGPVTATLRLVVIAPKGIVAASEADLDGEALTAVNEAFVQEGLTLNSEHDLVVRNSGCYPSRQTVKLNKAGVNLRVVVLTKEFDFRLAKTSDGGADVTTYPKIPRWDRNFVFSQGMPAFLPSSQLALDFARGYELRDWAPDPKGNRILAVNATTGHLLVYSNDANSQRIGELALDASEELKSPEGLHVDGSGNIFVADWGNHRVVQFDEQGRVLRVIGSLGQNRKNDPDAFIRLTFPTRVAVLEDLEGVQYQNEPYHRESLLVVSDLNGVHVATLAGEYLDTIVLPDQELAAGEFYGIRIKGYDESSVLHLIRRDFEPENRVLQYLPR